MPAHLEVSALIRATEAAGGFATVLAKGERDAGTILIVSARAGASARLWERMPRLDGQRVFAVVMEEDNDNRGVFQAYMDRRRARDRDIWLIELDVADPERLIAEFAG